MITKDQEIVSFTLALDEVASPDSAVGPNGLRFMCRQAAATIRKMRPDLSFTEHPITAPADGAKP